MHPINQPLIGVLAAGCITGSLAAEVIVFDNSDGIFLWSAMSPPADPIESVRLDITQPPEQRGLQGLQGIYWEYHPSAWTAFPMCNFAQPFLGESNARLARELVYLPPYFAGDLQCGGGSLPAVDTFEPGESIGPSADWQAEAPGWYTPSYACGSSCPPIFSFVNGKYIGVRITVGEGHFQYGWIRLTSAFAVVATPVAWAYETEVDTPIVVPKPSSCGLPGEPADLDQDGSVDGTDLALLLGEWNASRPACKGSTPCCADLSGDGFVNGNDLAILLAAWG